MEKVVNVNGIRLEIPDYATRETLLDRLGRPRDCVVYAITPGGRHQVLSEGEPISSVPSERLGVISRFRAADDARDC